MVPLISFRVYWVIDSMSSLFFDIDYFEFLGFRQKILNSEGLLLLLWFIKPLCRWYLASPLRISWVLYLLFIGFLVTYFYAAYFIAHPLMVTIKSNSVQYTATFPANIWKWIFVFCIFRNEVRRLKSLTKNWLAIGFLYWKYIYVLGRLWICDIFERKQEVVE